MKFILLETYVNLFEPDKKWKYAQQVWDILQNSYKNAGGLKGSGFESIESMVKNIPFWKLAVKNGTVLAVKMYKFKNNHRKGVASGRLNNEEGIRALRMIHLDEISTGRAYTEISGKMEAYYHKIFGNDFDKIKIPVSIVQTLLPDKKIIPLEDGYHYQRIINGEMKEKIAVGNPNSLPRYYSHIESKKF